MKYSRSCRKMGPGRDYTSDNVEILHRKTPILGDLVEIVKNFIWST